MNEQWQHRNSEEMWVCNAPLQQTLLTSAMTPILQMGSSSCAASSPPLNAMLKYEAKKIASIVLELYGCCNLCCGPALCPSDAA